VNRLALLVSLSVTILLAFQPSFATEQFRTLWRGQWVNYVEVGDYAITEGDIIMGKKDEVRAWREAVERGQLQTELTRKALAIGNENRLWNVKDASGVVLVPYTITTAKPNIDAAIAEVNRALAGAIRWIPRTTEDDYVDFNLASENIASCSSFVGRLGGKQTIAGDPECSVGTMVHEMGHAMGLWHVQQDADSPNYVEFRLANMDPSKRSNNQPIFGTRTYGGYDYESNMHYSRTAFTRSAADRITLETKPAGITVGASPTYSASDLDALLRLYGRVPQKTTIHSNPSGLRVIVDGVSYTTPAEFTWPVGSVHRMWVESGLQSIGGFRYAFGRWSHDPGSEVSSQLTWQVRPGDGSLGAPSGAPSDTVIAANFIRLIDVQKTAANQAGGASTVTTQRSPWPGTTSLYPQFTTFDLLAAPSPGFDHYFNWSSAFASKGGAGVLPRLSLLLTGSVSIQTIGALFHAGPTLRVNVIGSGTEDGINVRITPPGGTPSNSVAPRIARSTLGDWRFEMVQPQGVGSSIRYMLEGYEGFDDATTATVAMPPAGARDVTIRARREVQPFRQVQPSCAGSISLSNSSTWLATGSPLTVNLVSNGIGVFAGWSGTLSGTATSQTITVGNDVPEFVARFNSTSTPLSLTSISPQVIGDESSNVTLRLRGNGFFAGTRVYIAGQLVLSTFIDSTTIDATVSRASLSSGRLPVYVGNELSLSCNAFSSSLALDVLPSGSRSTVTMVEYYNPSLDYYFFTGRAADQALLDGIADWRRTGAQIKLLARSSGEAAPLERFFFASVARSGSRGSHFFSSLTGDRVLLTSLNSTNAVVARKPFLEGVEGYTIPKLANGNCPERTQAVYRAFKGEPRYVDDGNHRFSTSLTQHRDMVDRLGWIDEGIVFCAVQ
jgi:hypothetical protein